MKNELFESGLALAKKFCERNRIAMPAVKRLAPTDPLYGLATCAYYRPTTIHIMVEKCASPGRGGRAWSWPAYVIDRTPYGVIQHELGHHVDHVRSNPARSREDFESLFSWRIYQTSKEKPLTGYLGTDEREATFYMEWFAENFRLYVTNPDLSRRMRPRFFEAMAAAGLRPVVEGDFEAVLKSHQATGRILAMALRKATIVRELEFKI